MRTIARWVKLPVLGFALINGAAHAEMLVGDYGATSWQTTTHTFTQSFTGSVLLGVSNYGDTLNDSVALFDHLVGFGPSSNAGFTAGNFDGYTVNGTASIIGTASSHARTQYLPTDGSPFARLGSNGASTAWIGGTNGAWLEISNITAAAGTQIAFDWAFLAQDYAPFADFAFFGLRDASGTVFYSEHLATIGTVSAVPVPPAIWLFGSGLAGLFAAARRRAAASAC